MVRNIVVALISICALSMAGAAQAVLVVTPNQTANDLVNTLLAGSSGVTFSNAQLVGDPGQNGTFTGGNSAGLGFNSGIVLSSGNVSDLPLPPIFPTGASTDLSQPGDAKLDPIVAPNATQDASVLKFDFVPNGNQVQFSYVFGSTEYNGFVNDVFNDVFAFFVNDVNSALIPGTNTPVAINTVNCGGPVDGPTSQGSPGPSPSNCDKFINNRNEDDTVGANELINLGGMTQVFSFVANVNPNVTNTMYLTVADTSDGILDSAVFIAGGTLSTCGGPNQPPCGGGSTCGGPDQPPCGGGSSVPEPGTVALLGLAFAGICWARRREN